MKKLILTAFPLTVAVSVFAQGSVLWQSGDGVHTYHYWSPSSTNIALSLVGAGPNDTPVGSIAYQASGMAAIGANGFAGKFGASTTFAQLLWANGANQAEASLVPGGATTTFKSGSTAGLLVAVLPDTITGLTPDGAAGTFEMVAWDNSTDNYPTWTQASAAWAAGIIAAGKSGAFTVLSIGGSVNTQPVAMAPSFNLYYIPILPEPSTVPLTGLGAVAVLIFRRRK